MDSVTGVEYFSFGDTLVAATEKQPGMVVYASTTSGVLQGGSGDDSLIMNYTGGVYRLVGGAGNDSLYASKSAHGTAVYSGPSSDYTITRDPITGLITVSDNVPGRDGRDTMTNYVAALEFSDGTMLTTTYGQTVSTVATATTC